eukprot:4542340-Lingulodinium_polyedra.AAC.1
MLAGSWKGADRRQLVDAREGDERHFEYRSRFVAKEIKRGKDGDLFAATPSLEAKKVLMLMAMIEIIGCGRGGRR